MTVEVRVQPRARRNALSPLEDGRWKLFLTAPAVEGQANHALIEFFAKGLGISRSSVSIVFGEKSRQKVIALAGVSEEQFGHFAAAKRS